MGMFMKGWNLFQYMTPLESPNCQKPEKGVINKFSFTTPVYCINMLEHHF